MKEDGHHYRWSDRESKVLLAYMCGRIYCGDTPDYNEQKRKNYWMPGKWSVFPDTALNNLFQTKDLAISRTNRVYNAAPQKSAMIDEIIDQYKDVFPKSSSAKCILIGEILVISAVCDGEISEIAQFIALKFLK